MNRNITIDKAKIAEFCRTNHIAKFSLFGSAIRSDFDLNSDVDILVEFEQGHTPGFFRLTEMEDKLSSIFDGRKIDLKTPQELSRFFRDKVVTSAEVQYVHR